MPCIGKVEALQGRWVAAQDSRHGADILDHHGDVGVLRIARLTGKIIIAEGADLLRANLLGENIENFGGEDFRSEDCRDTGGTDLVDEGGNLAGGGFGEVGWLNSAKDLESVAGGEEGEGVVVGEKFAVGLGNGRGGYRDCGVQLFEDSAKAIEVGSVVGGSFRVEVGKGRVDKFSVPKGKVGCCPEVRIRVSLSSREGEVEDVFARADGAVAEKNDGALVGKIGTGELERRKLEVETVDDH